jgi:hypothetical protein
MGYYITLEQSTAVLPKKHQAEAYQRMCALNDTDEGKTGGSKDEKWFAWMDPNYPDTCADAKAILMDLGFWFDENEDGDLLFNEYDCKMGNESDFLRCIGDLLTGEMVWRGEDHNPWRYTFGDKMRVHEPVPRDIEWEQVPFFSDERLAVANEKPWR